jgi:threonine/homoserine/homoserine lactone efflux protein
MGQAIGQVLSFGVGVALSPMPIIAVVLMLATPKGRVNGPAFLVGWVVGLAVVGVITLVLVGDASASSKGTPATWVSLLKIVLGLLLLAQGIRRWRGRPRRAEDAKLPGWMQAIDTFTAPKAAGMGLLLSAVINPKNLVLTVGAGAAIAQTGVSTVDEAVALLVFVLLASVGVGGPVAIYYLTGERAKKILGSLHDWMARENTAIMAVICLIFAAKLIGDAITALSA